MFELQDKTVKIANVNLRAEKHGDENELACDIKIEAHCPASVLDSFDPAIAPFLFRAPKTGEQQSLPMEEGEQRTERRCPRLGSLKWDEEFPGYRITIAGGMGLKKPIELEADLTKFQFEPLDGGSVKITFNASVHPDGKTTGQLAEQIQEEVELTLKAPEPAEWTKPNGDLAEGAKPGVLVTGVDFKRNKSTKNVKTVATLSDGRRIECDEVPYDPAPEHVLDLLKFVGVEAAIAPALVSDWPKAA